MPKPQYRYKRWKHFNLEPPYTVGVDDFQYNDIPFIRENEIDPNIYKPLAYDMVDLITQRKTIKGWWTGDHWEGYRLLPSDKVLAWRKNGDL